MRLQSKDVNTKLNTNVQIESNWITSNTSGIVITIFDDVLTSSGTKSIYVETQDPPNWNLSSSFLCLN
jgi:hypothetical protein